MLDFIKGIFTVAPKTDSQTGEVNKKDVQFVLQNGLLVGGAAAVTYIAANITQVDLGDYGPAILPFISMALVSIIQWLKNNIKE